MSIMKAIKRRAILSQYTDIASTGLAGFDVQSLGAGTSVLGDSGQWGSDLIMENGRLMIKTSAIDSFYAVFAGQNKMAQSKAASFLAQDTLLGEASSKKGTVLGGVI